MMRVFMLGKRLSVRLGESLGQTRLFAVRGILMHNALGNRFIDSGGGGAQLRAGGGHALVQGDLILLNSGLYARFHHTIPQVLGLAHLYALHGGLNVWQLPSPPGHFFAGNQHRLFYHIPNKNASIFFFIFSFS
jgi:hypothetical protein